jgi:hypothetical protein
LANDHPTRYAEPEGIQIKKRMNIAGMEILDIIDLIHMLDDAL